jgi:hypothetical protein
MLTPRDLEVLDVVGEVMRERLAEVRGEYEGKLADLTEKVAALEARPADLPKQFDTLGESAAEHDKELLELRERIRGLERRLTERPPPDLAPLEAKLAELEQRPTNEEVLTLAQGALTSTRASLLEVLQRSLIDQFKALPVPQKGDKGDDGKGVTIEDFRALFDASYARFELETERRIMDLVQRTLDRIPLPKDGRDGFGFDDLDVVQTGERTLEVRFTQGERSKVYAFKFPWLLDRGVWQKEAAYEQGDVVSWGGSSWIAQRADPGKPNEGDGWRLAVKRGRDGKDGTQGLKGDPGPAGKNGRDLTGRLVGSA